MEVLDRLREIARRVKGLSARAVLNYVIVELEHGARIEVVIERALKLAEEELRDLEEVIVELRKFLGRCENGVGAVSRN